MTSVRSTQRTSSRQSALVLVLAAPLLIAPLSLQAQETTASLAGRVVAADGTGAPVRRAIVALSDPATTQRVGAITDDQGRFAFVDLRPGRYRLTASKDAYLTATYGATRPGRPGTLLSLSAGQRLGDIQLSLARGAAVSGTVRDMTGAPVANTFVTVISVEAAARFPPGLIMAPFNRGVDSGFQTVSTDDRGIYRAYGLPAGEYVIAASPAGQGNSVGVSRRSDAEIDGALRALQQPGSRGTTAGAAPAGTPRYDYAPTFYPGTPMPDEAGRIRLAAGETREGLDFWYDLVPTAAIEAEVLWPGSTRETLSLSLIPLGPPLPLRAPRAENTLTGRFTYANVPPGRYVLRATAGRGATALWARTQLLVNGADVTGLTLALQPAMSFAGRLVIDTARTPPPNLEDLFVGLRAAGPGGGSFFSEAIAGASPAFAVTGILPGTFSMSVSLSSPAGAGWWLRSAIADGRDLLDTPLEFGTSLHDVKDAVLTLTDRRTELTGRLQTAAGQPATEYYVIVFSADRAHWFPGARRTRAVRPASDGTFSVTELPAGAYLMAALTDVATDEWNQAPFLEAIAPLSVPVAMPDGGTVRQDLQIAR